MSAMRLRPHHILDIITGYGQGVEFTPHPYGHAQHTVAAAILTNLELEIELVVGADEICRPCTHLGPDGRCDDILRRLDPPLSKQTYNDGLDRRLLDYLGLTAPCVMTLRRYLETVNRRLPDLARVCTHPGENRDTRLAGLQRGMQQLGITDLRCLPLSDVHAHVFGDGKEAPLAIINLARREKLEKVYLLCRGYREQLPTVRANRDVARMMMYPDVGGPGWWTHEEPFLLENRDNVYGVKLNPSRSPVRPSLESHGELFASAEKHGFVIVTHTDAGESSNAANFEPLLEKYPDTKLVLYHAAPLDTSIRLMKRFANVHVDVSFTAFNAQVQKRVLDEVGPERIVFGIDTPLGWPKDDAGNVREHYRDVIEEIAPWYGWDKAVLAKVLHGNSARLFGA